MLTREQAIDLLIESFGESAVKEFLTRDDYETDEIADAVMHLYKVHGREDTAEIFKALEKQLPNIAEYPLDRGCEHLERFTKKLWTYKFSVSNVLDYVEIGTNHIVLYPKPTDVGRRFLACLVATMWNPENEHHFDPYRALRTTDDEITYAPVLDHAGYQYSNSKFTLFNGPELLKHYHPVKGGCWHTHFSYNRQFPGLLAVYSVIKLAHYFVDDSDHELADAFKREMVDCINQHAQYIVGILLDCLPDALSFYENSTLNKLARLKPIFLHIQSSGVHNTKLLDFDLVALTEDDYEYIQGRIPVESRFIVQILKNFLFDLDTYIQRLSALCECCPLTEEPLLTPDSPSTIKKLFQLTCCLDASDTPLQKPSKKLFAQNQDVNKLVGAKSAEVESKVLMQDLLRVYKCSVTQVQLFRAEHAFLTKTTTLLALVSAVDDAIVGYRERVAIVMRDTEGKCKFTMAMFSHGTPSQDVDRSDTGKAFASLRV